MPERGKASTWILTLVHRRAVDLVRREERRRADPLDSAPEPAAATAADEEAWLRLAARARAGRAEAAPDQQREALELAYYGGFTQSELAERLGQPLGTIKSRMFIGLARLRELLGEPRNGDAMDVHELTAAYALDALDADERERYEEHLASCEECREELAALGETAAALAWGVESPEPPPALRGADPRRGRAPSARTSSRCASAPRVFRTTAAVAAVAAVRGGRPRRLGDDALALARPRARRPARRSARGADRSATRTRKTVALARGAAAPSRSTRPARAASSSGGCRRRRRARSTRPG